MVLICLPGPIKKVVLFVMATVTNKKERVSISIQIVKQSIDRLSSMPCANMIGPMCLPEQGDDVTQGEEDGKEGEVRSCKGQGRLLTWQIRTKGEIRNDRSAHVSTDSLCSFLDNTTAMIQPMVLFFFVVVVD